MKPSNLWRAYRRAFLYCCLGALLIGTSITLQYVNETQFLAMLAQGNRTEYYAIPCYGVVSALQPNVTTPNPFYYYHVEIHEFETNATPLLLQLHNMDYSFNRTVIVWDNHSRIQFHDHTPYVTVRYINTTAAFSCWLYLWHRFLPPLIMRGIPPFWLVAIIGVVLVVMGKREFLEAEHLLRKLNSSESMEWIP